MDFFKRISSGEAWVVDKTVDLSFLELAQGGVITAPEGKSVTLTCDGVQLDIVPGIYQGMLTLTVTDDIDVAYRDLTHKYKTAVYIADGKYLSEKSVAAAVSGGEIGDGEVKGAVIDSYGSEFNGIYVTGGGKYAVKDTQINAVGNGGNDFFGFGAALCVHGSAEVTVENCDITTCGAARNAAFVGENSRVAFNNCRLSAKNGVLPPTYEDTIKLGQMKAVPWMLSLRGNCRATNLCQNAYVRYENCRITSGGWGVLSSDDLVKGGFEIVNSTVEITGPSGYGVFVIGECDAMLDHSVVKVPDYGFIFAGASGSATLKNGTVVEADRFALSVGSAKSIDITGGCKLRGDEAVFLSKDGACNLSVDGAELVSKSGVILQMVINDDPRSITGYFIDPKEEEVKDNSIDLTVAEVGEDAICRFANMEMSGDFYNGSANVKGDTGPKMAMPPMPAGEGVPMIQSKKSGARNMLLSLENAKLRGVVSSSYSRHFAAKITKENCREISHFSHRPCQAVNNGVILKLDGQSAWTVTGASYLTKLEVEEGAKISAPEGRTLVMTVDGNPAKPKAGIYTGNILIDIQ